MLQPDVISFGIAMDAAGWEEAIHLLKDMKRRDVKANAIVPLKHVCSFCLRLAGCACFAGFMCFVFFGYGGFLCFVAFHSNVM